MKLITFFIILLTLLNYSNQALIDVHIDYDPVAKYGTKDFNSHYGLLMFLDVSEFQKDENIYYYFEFDKDDALHKKYSSYSNNKKHTNYESLIEFYVAETNEIVQNDDIYSVYFGSYYEKTPKSTKSGSSKAKFYFSSKKKDSKYLIIGLIPDSRIDNKFTFKNTETDESKLGKTTIIIIIVIIVVIIIIAIIVGVCYYKKSKKKKNTQPVGYDQQGLYIQQPQNSQNVQVYTQQPQYSQQGQYVQQPQYSQQGQYVQQPQYNQQGQYVQQPQYNQQGQYAPMSNEPGYSSQGVVG